MKSLGSLLLSTLVAGALVLGSVSASAVADDVIEPTPSATVEPTAEPTAEPSAEPTVVPTVEPSAEPEPSVSPTPSEAPKGVAPRGPAEPAPAGSQDLRGRVIELSDHAEEGTVKLFETDEGYLTVDFAAVELPADSTRLISVRITVPAAVETVDGVASFAALSTVGTPLVAEKLLPTNLRGFGPEAMVNQNSAVAATHQVYAVAVTPANVCGTSCAATSGQSPANIQLDVDASNSFWLSQSDGKVGFELVGTTSWYKSAFGCDANVPTNFGNLLNEATAKASAQLGYVKSPNTHLVLIFPRTANCGPAIGLGTVGSSINAPGALWAIGSGRNGALSYPSELHTLAHELGHNLSLGHADWLDCASSSPAPNRYGQGCYRSEYGDASDVMGIGNGVTAQGSLSSPHAIRSGMWSPSSYAIAPTGTTMPYVLKPLSSGTGLRSVVVEGNNGVNYFVEYRDTTGIDAPYAQFGCGTQYEDYCAASTPGVRILQLEQQVLSDGVSNFEFKGFAGDNSFLIGRTVSGSKYVNLVAGQSLTIAGVTVAVTSVTNGVSASVNISRVAAGSTIGTILIDKTAGTNDGWWYEGDTLTGFLGAGWMADSYTYQWKRNNVDIAGATAQSYTLTGADVGTTIRVDVKSYKGAVYQGTAFDAWGPIKAGITQGTVGIDASSIPFTATTSGWTTPGVAFAYQWRRNGAAIAGATASTYSPTTLDDGKLLSVRVVATKTGNPTVAVVSAAKNYTLTATGAFTIGGTAQVGETLTLAGSPSYSTVDGPVFPIVHAQWFRAGVAIPGATGSTYTVATEDFTKAITVRGVATASGYATNTATSAAVNVLLRGAMPGSLEAPVITKDPATLKLKVELVPGSVTEPNITPLYQWYRDGAAIAGASAQTFQLTAADSGKVISARIIATKPGRHSVSLYSLGADYSIMAATGLATSGWAKVGETLTAGALSYSTTEGSVIPTLAHQWFRNGVAIVGATASTYTAVAADFGTKLSVRVTATTPGFVTHVATSGQTVPVVKGTLSGSFALPDVTKSALLKLTAALPAGSVTDTGTALAYQWFRSGVAIPLATTSTFQLTAADNGKLISVRIIVSKLNYDSVTLNSTPVNYTVVATGTLTATGAASVGEVLTASELTYSTNEGAITPPPAYQWFRNGVAIAGAVAASYPVVAADFGTKLTVRASVTYPGYLPHSVTSAATVAVTKGILSGDLAAPTVVASPTVKLTASLPVGSITDTGTTTAYQWFRDGVAITGATTASFQLTAADYNKSIHVRFIVSKLNYTSATLTSAPVNYSVLTTGIPVFDGEVEVGTPLELVTREFTAGGVPVEPTLSYQWLRDGVAITNPDPNQWIYTPVALDLGKSISVRVTATVAGYLASVSTSAATQKVGNEQLTWNNPVAVTPAGLVLTAAGDIDQVVPVAYARQWFRNGVAIVGATGLSYTLTAADLDKAISVRVTASSSGKTSVVATSAARDYSLVATGAVTVVGTAKVGESLTVGLPTYSTVDGAASPTLAYQWLRGGVVIAGATGASYTAVAADYNTKLSVRVTASLAGFLPRVSTSAATVAFVKGTLSGDLANPTVVSSPTAKLTASLTPGSVTDTGTTIAYQWFRNGVAIPLATTASFQLTAADYNKQIHVRLIVSKLNYTSVTLTSTPTNHSVVATGLPVLDQPVQVGFLIQVFAPEFTPNTAVVTYQWLRDGVAITGETADDYELQPIDFGKTISARVTGSIPGYLPSVTTSAATQKVGNEELAWTTPVGVSPAGPVLTADGASQAGSTYARQWFRNGVAIVGATGLTYTLTAADLDKAMSVRVTASKPLFTSIVATSTPRDYSLVATGSVTVVGTAKVGESLTVGLPTYSTVDGAASPTLAYQWLRGGVAIAGATGASYTAVAADFNTKLSVRVTASLAGFLPRVSTSAATVAFVKGTLSGDLAAPTVVSSPTAKLTASLTPGSVTDAGTTVAYQWFRAGVAIPLATTASFQLTAADYNKQIHVRLIVSKLNYDSATLVSAPVNYSVTTAGTLAISGTPQFGLTLTVNELEYATAGGPVSPTLAYQWLRNGVAITGATGSSYTLVAADIGTKLTVRVTAAQAGFVSHTATSAATVAVAKGVLSGHYGAPTVTTYTSTMTLLAALSAGSVTDSGIAIAYQWFRNGVAITGATTASYVVAAADFGKEFTVRLTVTKANFTTVTLLSNPIVP